MKNTITLPTSASTKEEEIAILETIAAAMPKDNTYLSAIFTRDFIAWTAAQIKKDFTPDLHAAYTAMIDEANRANAEVMKLSGTLDAERRQNTRKIQALEADKQEANKELENVCKLLLDERMQNARETKEHFQKISEKMQELAQVQSALTMAENEIVRLKAQLFDATRAQQ